jgi:3-oxoacyl-[acyl-carrier protein] reductase
MSRHALLIGGARGIGHGIAIALLDDGWRITVADIAPEVPVDLVARGAAFEQADCSDPDIARALVEGAGPIDALLITAGPYRRVPLLKETPEGWRSMFAGNLDTVFFTTQAALPGMKARGWGRIVAFSMANAERLQANPFVTGHYIAKIGVLALIRTLAKAGARAGVTANCISPGFIESGSRTPSDNEKMLQHVPAGRLGTVEDAVAAARYLLSDDASYVNGTNLVVSGAYGV